MVTTHQELPEPTPTTVMGEQVRPTCAVTSWTTTPMAARMPAAAALSAFWTESQHWMGPVLQDDAGSPPGVGVAAARIAREATVKSVANMMRMKSVSEAVDEQRWVVR